VIAGDRRGGDVSAAERANWGTPPPSSIARGIAIAESFSSIAARVVEVSIERRQIRVHRVVCAIDCGIAVNPAGRSR
jgi:isoquinoline 1-oxidoreductase beta subunit